MIDQGVILAAGLGTRFSRIGENEPKPLMPVGGMPLLERIITLFRNAGVDKIVVVLGFKKEKIEAYLREKNITVEIVTNADYRKGNAISLLKAQDSLNPAKPFVLAMGDHIFSNEYLENFFRRAIPAIDDSPAVAAVDKDLNSIPDIDDATKVFLENNRIIKIGKDLKAYNGVDSGLFLCKHEIFGHLEDIYKENDDFSLSEGLKATAAAVNGIATVDMTGEFWHDVDTPVMKEDAEKRLVDLYLSKKNSKYPWNRAIDDLCKQTILTELRSSLNSLQYFHIFYLVAFILILSVGLRFNLPGFSIILCFVTVFFFSLMNMIAGIIPESRYEKNKMTEINIFQALITLSMLPVIFGANFIVTILAIAFTILCIFYPFIRNFFGFTIKLPFIEKGIHEMFFSFQLFVFLLPVLFIIGLNCSLISVIFVLYLAINTPHFVNTND